MFATVERAYWKNSLTQHELTLEDLRAHTADIKEHHQLFDPRPVWTTAKS